MEDKLSGTIVGTDGNAFAILGKFQRDARRAGWPADKIKKVVDDATSGDYDHLIMTIYNQYDEDAAHG